MKPTTPSAEKIDSVIARLAFHSKYPVSTGPYAWQNILCDAIALIQSLRQSQQGEPSAWIPLTERQPTIQDANERGDVLVRSENGYMEALGWNCMRITTGMARGHFCTPPAPPIPELTAEQKLAEEDKKARYAALKKYYATVPSKHGYLLQEREVAELWADAVTYGRQSQRSQGGAK